VPETRLLTGSAVCDIVVPFGALHPENACLFLDHGVSAHAVLRLLHRVGAWLRS